MKKIIIFIFSAALLLTSAGCVSNSKYEELKAENEELRNEINNNADSTQATGSVEKSKSSGNVTEIKSYNIEEPITVQTEYGDYNVSILGASKAIKLNQDGNYPIIISFEIENLSYDYGDSSDGFSMPWQHSRGGIIVADNDKNILKCYDVLGPKEVHTPDNIPIGYKEKGSYAFFPVTENVMPASIQVQICNDNTPVGTVELPVTD